MTPSAVTRAQAWAARATIISRHLWALVPQNFLDAIGETYWIDGLDEGLNYCRSCAEDELRRLIAEGRAEAGSCSVGGGFDSSSDRPSYCEGCSKKLNYSPTEYCVFQELEHFNTYRVSLAALARGRHDDAYQMASMLDQVSWMTSKDSYGVRQQAQRLIRKLERQIRQSPLH